MPHRAGAVLSPTLDDLVPPFDVVEPLLRWADDELRDLPWRRTRDPWAILVSEVMLQQTQVTRVIDRWTEFLQVFPTPASCASGSSGDVIALWAGLGYNRRAVNLWRASVEICDRFGGELPATVPELQSLPGIGPYTARAVAVFAFEAPVGVVDTNVGRLLARWMGERLTPNAAQAHADALVPDGRSWTWNQGLFDFATAICTKRAPDCGSCPVRSACAWRGEGDDPAVDSAGVSTGQSRFEGSIRQVRGRILDAARQGTVARHALSAFARTGDSADDVDAIADGLVRDGLLVRDGDLLRLP